MGAGGREQLRSVVEKFFGNNINHKNVLSLLHFLFSFSFFFVSLQKAIKQKPVDSNNNKQEYSSPSHRQPNPHMSSTPTTPSTTPVVFTRVETVVVSARVTGQRVELTNRDFAGGVVSPEVVRDLLAKNAHTPVVVLVLRACKLAALPRELGQLTFLHELDVSDNALTDLPIELVALTSLLPPHILFLSPISLFLFIYLS